MWNELNELWFLRTVHQAILVTSSLLKCFNMQFCIPVGATGVGVMVGNHSISD